MITFATRLFSVLKRTNCRFILFCMIWISTHIAARTPVSGKEPAVTLAVCQVAMTFAWVGRRNGRTRLEAALQTAVAAIVSGLAAYSGLTSVGRNRVLDTPVLVMFESLLILIAAVFLVWQALVSYRDSSGELGTRMYAAATGILPSRLLKLAGMEAKALWIAIFRWGGPVDVPSGAQVLTNHISIAPLMYAFVGISLIEAVVFHIVAHLLPILLALPLVVIGDVLIVYFIGIAKSLRLYPSYIHGHEMRLRVGMFMDVTVTPGEIVSIAAVDSSKDYRRRGCAKASLLAYPNFIVFFRKPIQNPLPIKVTKEIDCIALKFDDPVLFVSSFKAWFDLDDIKDGCRFSLSYRPEGRCSIADVGIAP